MKKILILSFALAACGGSATDTAPTRYNFAVIDGANQVSTAGAPALEKRITSQLTRDPQGKFATRVFDFLAPTIAYAQGLTLSGTPVAGAIVCGREAKPGEPQVIPLCAFTLADGKAANSVQGGTKAGKFNILFTAQVPAQQPVADSTTVTVQAGRIVDAAGGFGLVDGKARVLHVGDAIDFNPTIVFARDQYGNTRDRASYGVDSTSLDLALATKGSVFTVPAGSECPIVLNGPGCHTVYFWIESWRGSSQFNVQ